MTIRIEVHDPGPRPAAVIIQPGIGAIYACPNCGSELEPNGSCSRCPTWARLPGLAPYPPRRA